MVHHVSMRSGSARGGHGDARWALASALIACWLSVATFVRAEGPTSRDADYRLAERAAAVGDWELAAKAYESADAQGSSLGTLMGIGDARYRLGHWGRAATAYDALLTRFGSIMAKSTASIVERKYRDAASHTAVLAIRVDTPGAVVVLDAQTVADGPTTKNVYVDTGVHTLRIHKEDCEDISQLFAVVPGDRVTFERHGPLRALRDSTRAKLGPASPSASTAAR